MVGSEITLTNAFSSWTSLFLFPIVLVLIPQKWTLRITVQAVSLGGDSGKYIYRHGELREKGEEATAGCAKKQSTAVGKGWFCV